MNKRSVALISLGCAKNLVDSEVMLGFLSKEGYRIVVNQDEADVIIINTCGFIGPARQEAEEAFSQASKRKKERPGLTIVATGCYVQKVGSGLQSKFPLIDVWTGVNDFHHIDRLIKKQPVIHEERTFLYDHTSPRKQSTPSSWSYIKISEGCSHRCGFCTIPLIKGDYQSRSIESITKEAKKMVDLGNCEINLISQDSTYFGRDRNQPDGLTRLLESLLNIQNLPWIRILYMYPEEITDSLLDIMKDSRICSYIDAPFQHAHPEILKQMGRGISGRRSIHLIEKIRSKIPEAALRTSLIVGFPGEGKEEFQMLKQFVREARFSHLGIFLYSPEKGTRCWPLGDPVKPKLKETRRNEIMEIQSEISFEINQSHVGKKLSVLLVGELQGRPDIWMGRTTFQAPEVDGVVFVENSTKTNLKTSLPTVEITHNDVYDLYGRII